MRNILNLHFYRKNCILLFVFVCTSLFSQINYNFTSTTGTYNSLTTYTTLHSTNVDDAISASTNIGFTFYYGCQAYTTFQASTNGVMFLGTSGAFSNAFNDLTSSTDRPAIAPLWDDLKTSGGGRVCYNMTGTAPNRVLTVEWFQMLWDYSATTWGISFQVKLYETSNRIEFIYQRNGNATQYLVSADASIGISGPTSGDFYSLGDVSASPTVSKITETSTLSSKPATNQIYRWDPITCSGTPSGYALSITIPSNTCTAYTATLNVSGTGGCGIQYTFQSGPSASGPWTTFAISNNSSTTFNVTGLTYFRTIVTCTISGGGQ